MNPHGEVDLWAELPQLRELLDRMEAALADEAEGQLRDAAAELHARATVIWALVSSW